MPAPERFHQKGEKGCQQFYSRRKWGYAPAKVSAGAAAEEAP